MVMPVDRDVLEAHRLICPEAVAMRCAHSASCAGRGAWARVTIGQLGHLALHTCQRLGGRRVGQLGAQTDPHASARRNSDSQRVPRRAPGEFSLELCQSAFDSLLTRRAVLPLWFVCRLRKHPWVTADVLNVFSSYGWRY